MQNITFIPTLNRVLLAPIKEESPAGLYLPESPGKVTRYEVVAVGPEVKAIEPGQMVHVGGYAGATIVLGGRDHICIDETAILGIYMED